MWILESSSELFQGRRLWLKPGKSYLFGRVKKEKVRFAIEHKTISRKHFIIRVDDVNIEDVGNINARTRITIEDQNSKAGTIVNGEHTKGTTKELKLEENHIKPGSLPEDLVIKWHSFVLTYNLLKKEVKSGVLKAKQERVKDLDIKAVSEYIVGKTTHLVVNKRNTPKSLQALIDGKPLVTESYIDLLEYVSTSSDLNEEENLSPLEYDFDSAWPEPFDYLPPPGREPTSQPAETYKPNRKRKKVFEKFTFVFLDHTQYENLLPPIVTGHGKALLFKTIVGETTTEELVTFLRNAAGHKGFGDARKGFEKGGVILVRYRGDTGTENWTNTLINEVSLRLDQRAIDQGEFLNAILSNNGMLLRQAVPFENNYNTVSAPSVTTTTSAPISELLKGTVVTPENRDSGNAPPISLPPPSRSIQPSQDGNGVSSHRSSIVAEPKRAAEEGAGSSEDEPQVSMKRTLFIRPKTTKGFDFDDEFDPNAIIPYEDDNDEEEDVVETPQGLSDPDAVKIEPTSAKKRPRSLSREESTNFGDEIDHLLPAAASMKKRKLASRDQGDSPADAASNKPIPALLKQPKPDREIDVRKIAKAQRQAEDERIKKEQENIDDDLRIEPGQSLPVYDVETILIEPPTRRREYQETDHVASDRWDPKWNGRKNFKGFRPAMNDANGSTATSDRRRNLTKVIVPMVDAKTSTYGMGDQYWDKTEQEKERDRERRKRQSQRTTQSQSDQSKVSKHNESNTVNISEGEDEHASTNDQGIQPSPEISRLQHEAEEIMHHAVDVDEPRRTRASDTQSTAMQSLRGAKRLANGVGRGAAKKQKTLPVTTTAGSDSEDSDDMKFRFGSRRNGKDKT